MPKFTHTLSTDYNPSFRAKAIAGMFDVPVEEKLSRSWDIDIPIENEDWNIGMIVGPSGSGKSTIARAAFPDSRFFDGSTHENWGKSCFPDYFPESMELSEITGALSQVGFSSPPSWLLPFSALSNGQKFRAEMARITSSLQDGEVAVIDEFTSVVDRNVAKSCSAAIQKMIRRTDRKMVAVSCHYDIAEWLAPDWIYYVDTGVFKITRGELRRPKIEIVVQRVHHSAWRIFKEHHYLNASINKSAHCFLATINDNPVAFCAAIPFPHPKMKGMWRAHRTVCLPDYQGLGIGSALNDAVAQHFINKGKRYSGVASHPAMINHRLRSKNWELKRSSGRVPISGKSGVMQSSNGRLTVSFEFIGKKND